MTGTRGKFITFEGGEGSGKSTQIKTLSLFLKGRGIDHIITREPGGSDGAEELRTLMLTGDTDRWTAMSEALMVTAGRVDHVEKLIKPALEQGQWVISDRFYDSTKVYQGVAGGLGLENMVNLQKLALGDFTPDLTLILDIDVQKGLARAIQREGANNGNEDRFERKGLKYHQALREAYKAIAMSESDRCKLVDASGTIDQIADAIQQVIEPLIAGVGD
ncbi:thymidylate kinase [Kordiimonas sediminis]|uniref:Thymidylate kinase n=1 Tax=Kordiimonas sediminis TaxID=1735581 RepID=A0A919E8A4_9PROT|nr:dTMP kinase [Kordiimonas sediminis]GHF28098.1 thymidylate kinase [Kordiimonas sediminis]